LHITLDDSNRSKTKTKQEEFKLTQEVINFENDECVLLVDKVDFVENIDALGLVKWKTVFDFDPDSWKTGLHARIKKHIEKKAVLKYTSWQDTKVTITETSVTWIGVMGISNQISTMAELGDKEWRQTTRNGLDRQIDQLERYAENNTDLKVVVVWPENDKKVKHFHKIIDRLMEISDIHILVFLPPKGQRTDDEHDILEFLGKKDNLSLIRLELNELCDVIRHDCKPTPSLHEVQYGLPTSEGTFNSTIKDKDSLWLKEVLDVLFIDNVTGVEYTPQQLLEQERNFYRGGTLPWSAWYDLQKLNFTVERDIEWRLVEYLKSKHIKICKSGIVNLFHNPGAGGTTLAQRVLWGLRQQLPCVQIKHNVDCTIKEVVDRIQFIHTKTNLPILILVDGEERQRVEMLFSSLRNHACVIFLYVQRSFQVLQQSTDNNDKFYLSSVLSNAESKTIEVQYLKQCKKDPQIKRLKDVSWKENPTLLDFGLAVYSYSYDGIEKYVANILNVKEDQKELLPWQTAMCYLALVYFFGQSSLPCYFFTVFSGKRIKSISDFPDDMKELIVIDENESKSNMVRVSNYYVAQEILNQLLPFPNKHKSSRSPGLTDIAKRNLAGPAVQFVKLAGLSSKYPRSQMAQIMINTFISRNNTVDCEEDMGESKKWQRFSPLLEQASRDEPFTDRFKILNQLADSFPREAQFRAHLGRLYSICRRSEYKSAEKHLALALEIAKNQASGDQSDDEFNYLNQLDLMHIYHMYGCIILRYVARVTGKSFDKIKGCRDFKQATAAIIPDIKRACEFFQESRNNTPPGCAKCICYLDEIKIRLMFCHFVHKNSGCVSLMRFVENNESDVSKLVQESCRAMDELFMDCYSSVDPAYMNSAVWISQRWYGILFQKMIGFSKGFAVNDVNTRKLEIVQIKMKYADQSKPGILESIKDPNEIQIIANHLGKNIDDYRKDEYAHLSKNQKENDFKEWIFVIRNPAIKEVPEIETVLHHVEFWFEDIKSPMSRFYLFVLKSLLGFGEEIGTGNAELLRQALALKDEVVRYSRLVQMPRYPREWLGLPQTGFRRLYPGLRFFGQNIKDRAIRYENLEQRKGTIMSNDKPAGGFINLDLGPFSKATVQVFFVPARANDSDGMVGSKYKGERVEFVIGFSLHHGYDAFDVKPLRKTECPKCEIEIEALSKDKRVRCPRCKKMVVLNK